LTCAKSQAKSKRFCSSQGLSINVALDKDGKVANAYKVEGIPQSVIIGKDGIVKVVHVGFGGDLKSTTGCRARQYLEREVVQG
jgi:peroxiredoxin